MFPTPKYLTRDAAAAFLTAQGIELTGPVLADLAYKGKGPRFAKINGRAVYTVEWLTAWIEAEIAKPVSRRARRQAAGEGVTA
jgi:hypothetical protein